MTGEATATARLEVISAVPTARGCQVFSMIGSREQRAADRHAIDRGKTGAGRASEQDLAVARR